jgi:bifunctional oligoribonuclease and PAP phosphatase NrnA
LKYEENLSKIFKTVNKNNVFLLISHVYPDGDCLGSLTAFYKLLKNLNKQAYMFINSEIPYQYAFMPNVEKIKDTYPKDMMVDPVIIFLDCADIERAQFDMKSLKGKIKSIINIDHHMHNPEFGDINLVDHEKSATAELVFELFNKYYSKHIDADVATGLYVGLLTDTGRFQYSNTTQEVHKTVSYLLSYDIRPSKIFSYIYECEPRNRFKLLEIALKRIKIIDSESLIYSYVLKKDFQKLDLPYSANDGIIEMLRSVKDIDVAALFKQVEKDHFKVSLRSSNNGVDVSKIAQAFGGGGHKKAAAYSCNGKMRINIINLTKEVAKKNEYYESNVKK